MVEKFKKILEKISNEKGEVNFFGIFKMDEFTDKWSVVFCAEWLEKNKTSDFFDYFIKLIRKNLTDDESKTIARVGLFSIDEHLIDLLLAHKADSRIQDQPVNGNIIHDGYVLASNRNIKKR